MSLRQKDLARLQANNPRIPTRIVMGGNKLAFGNLPKEIQVTIKERLAEKDPVMAEGLKGNLPGILINGKGVTRDNIHEFEIQPKIEVKPIESKYTKEEVKGMNKKEQSDILNSLGITKIPILEADRIKKILEAQK